MTSEFDHLIEQQHEALDRFAKGELAWDEAMI